MEEPDEEVLTDWVCNGTPCPLSTFEGGRSAIRAGIFGGTRARSILHNIGEST